MDDDSGTSDDSASAFKLGSITADDRGPGAWLRATRGSSGPDCRIFPMRELPAGRRCRTDLQATGSTGPRGEQPRGHGDRCRRRAVADDVDDAGDAGDAAQGAPAWPHLSGRSRLSPAFSAGRTAALLADQQRARRVRLRGLARMSRPSNGSSHAVRARCNRCVGVRALAARGPYSRASNTRLNGVSAARRKRVQPPAVTTSRIRASPAWAPSARPTSCESEAGVHSSVENA